VPLSLAIARHSPTLAIANGKDLLVFETEPLFRVLSSASGVSGVCPKNLNPHPLSFWFWLFVLLIVIFVISHRPFI
jgi:hypothetical protein